MSYGTSLGKYIDNTALVTLPALTLAFEWLQNSWDPIVQNISSTESQSGFSDAVMSTELEFSIEKRR